MKKLKLTSKEITELINNKRVYLKNNEIIEIFNDDIILNNNGKIDILNSLNLEFIPSSFPENFLKEIICEHFNCEAHQVICTDISTQEATLRLRLTPKKELGIIVVTSHMAKINTKNLIEEDEDSIETHISKNIIGLYNRLSDTDYYFRWDDNFL